MVRQLTAGELKALMDRGEVTLFDVRPENERAVASIAGAHALDEEDGRDQLLTLDPDSPVAFYCHRGIRSWIVAERLVRGGFKNVHNLSGGIEDWSLTVDPGVARY